MLKIAYCITCKGRSEHIKKTLPKNLAENKHALFVLVNYGSPDDLMDYLRAEHLEAIDSGKLVIYSLEANLFRMAHAKNVAHRLAIREGADVLVNLDADNYTGPNFDDYVRNKFLVHGENAFLWSRMIPGKLARGISGRIAVTAKAFINAGGYDERFEAYSRDDKDFNERLRRMGLEAYEIDMMFLDAVRHNDKLRYKEYPNAKDNDYNEEVQCNSTATVVNFGHFGKCRVTRNFETYSIDIKEIPTRIFGIGMHKTGTTSLHAALEILGHQSAHCHWKSAHWAKKIWREMNNEGRSITLENNYALSDLPIALLYEKLDKAYPGSKYILTIRREEDWLKSVRNHWSSNNPWRHQWDSDPFTNRIHNILYGQKVLMRKFLSTDIESIMKM